MYVQLCLREQSQFHPSRITSKIGINDGRGQKCPYSNQSLSAIIKLDKKHQSSVHAPAVQCFPSVKPKFIF